MEPSLSRLRFISCKGTIWIIPLHGPPGVWAASAQKKRRKPVDALTFDKDKTDAGISGREPRFPPGVHGVGEPAVAADPARAGDGVPLLSNVVDSINDAVFFTDTGFLLTYCNKAAERMYGWQSAEVLGENVFDITGCGSDMEIRRRSHELLIAGKTWRAVVPQRHRDGWELWVDIAFIPLCESGGTVTGFVSVNRDVTEKQNAEERIAFQSNLLENINDAVIAADMRLAITYWNDFAELLYGRKSHEVRGTNAFDAVGAALSDERRSAILSEVGEGKTLCEEAIHHRGDGSALWVETSVKPLFDAGGAVQGLVLVNRDVTARRKAVEALSASEERYHTLFSCMTEGFALHECVCDQTGRPADYRFLDINKAYEEITGLRREDAVGKLGSEVLPEEDPQWIRMYGAVALTGKDIRFERYSSAVKKYLDVCAFRPMQGQFAVLITDITRRKRIEDQLRVKAYELALANKELETFSYSVSHDLRNPLHSLLSCVDVLKGYTSSLDADFRSSVDFIDRAGKRMSEVISDLLVLSRVARQEVVRDTVDLSAMALSSFDDVRRSAPQRCVRFSVEQGLVVRAEPGLARILLENLIRNSWKFTSKKATAEIEIGLCGEPKAYFVRDNGVGFDMNLVDKLFKPFVRLHSDKEYGGTGIGLSIVKRVVDKHGGTVWAESGMGRGTTVYFTFE